jgi:ribosome recycling factor
MTTVQEIEKAIEALPLGVKAHPRNEAIQVP